ncbi:MAG: hypothetical protein ACYC3I_06165 [Gemmataceae bacterium]
MQPVQIQCGHCGQVMAVAREHLGQQVRCPHCRQVVIAPPPAVPTSGAPEAPQPPLVDPSLHLPAPADDVENTFSKTHSTDHLFGRGEEPRLEMPPEPLAPTLPSVNAILPLGPQGDEFSTLPWVPSDVAGVPPLSVPPLGSGDDTAVLPSGSAAPWMSGSVTESLAPPAAEMPLAPREEQTPSRAASRRQRETKAPWFLLLVFLPLLLYSIVISVFAFLLYREYQHLHEQIRNPFETMPDVGDDPGVHKGKKVSRTDSYKPELAKLPLPNSLCTTLGKPLRIGDLQVTPQRVERQRVSVIVGKARPEPCQADSLVLYLELKNLSTDYAFAPLDNYFDRYWRPGMDLIPPLTQLEVGKQGTVYRCYGGPAHWHPRGDPANPREWVKGRHEQADFLQPAEEKQLFVCTDGNDAKAAAVLFGKASGAEYHGSFLWRVRVRRGRTRFQDRDYSATAVLGVRFTDKDIRQPMPDAE